MDLVALPSLKGITKFDRLAGNAGIRTCSCNLDRLCSGHRLEILVLPQNL
jgi:hypothetical protein